MKKTIIFFIILICLCFQSLGVKLTRAESATAAAEIQTGKIKERLEKTAKEGLETAKDQLEQKITAPQKKAYIGIAKIVSDDKITLEYHSQIYNITFNDSTVFSKPSGQTKINPDDFVIAMGFVYPDSENLSAHRISVITSPQPPLSRQLITGKIKEIDGTKITIDGKILNLTSKVNFDIKDIKNPAVDDLELEDNLFAIVTLDKNGDINQIKTVLVIPGRNNPASQEPTNIEASESAAATESASEIE